MSTIPAEPAPQGIQAEAVTRWLVEHIDGAVAPFTFDLIAGGRSNLTFRVTGADGTRYVLRRPPLGHVLATAHDMAREHRIIAAVGQTGVPVPPALGLCTDTEVNGAPFYVMGFVDGVVLDSVEKAAQLPVDLRRAASEHLIDVLADLHAVDVDAVGLGDFAKRDGYVERQVKRWSTQWENSKTRELPAIDEVARHLRDKMPEQHGVAIAHGDFRFGNCLTDIAAGRIIRIVETGFPSSRVNGSSADLQAQYIQALFAAWDEHADQILSITLWTEHDYSPYQLEQIEHSNGDKRARYVALVGSVGLRQWEDEGAAKPAWVQLLHETEIRGWQP